MSPLKPSRNASTVTCVVSTALLRKVGLWPMLTAARYQTPSTWTRAAVNIGHNPTFRSKAVETTHVTVEAFLLGFSGDIYERSIRVDFLHKIRDEQRFDAVEELVAQMRRDIAETADLQDPAFAEVGLAAPAAL